MKKSMCVILSVLLVIPGMVGFAYAAEAPDSAELHRMLDEFMAGATVNDAAAHDRFWADDLIYTSSSGERFGKAEIMKGLSAAKADPSSVSEEPVMGYGAEDVRIQQYGDTAIVAFTLVGTKAGDATAGTPESTQRFFNTGTFLRRDGTWKVVAWQATRIPAPNP